MRRRRHDMGRLPENGGVALKIPECWICLDSGVVSYTKKVDGYTAEHVAHCICDAGEEFNYEGENYWVPSVEEVIDPDEHAKNNIKNWLDAHKNNPEARKELSQRGIKIA
jgi:hypothetical protein